MLMNCISMVLHKYCMQAASHKAATICWNWLTCHGDLSKLSPECYGQYKIFSRRNQRTLPNPVEARCLFLLRVVSLAWFFSSRVKLSGNCHVTSKKVYLSPPFCVKYATARSLISGYIRIVCSWSSRLAIMDNFHFYGLLRQG